MSAGRFRMRTASTAASRDFGPNMTPMVDIVMVILIFFMAGTTILGPEWFLGAQVEQEQSAARGDRPDEPETPDDPFALDLPPTRVRVTLSRDAEGRTVVAGLNLTGASVEELERRLDELRDAGAIGSLEIVVQPSAGAPYQDVIRVYEACVRAGPRGASLARSVGAEGAR